MKNRIWPSIGIVFFAYVFVSCVPDDNILATLLHETEAAWTIQATYTQYPTYTPRPAVIKEITRIVVLTETITPTLTPTEIPSDVWLSYGPDGGEELMIEALAFDPRTPSTVYAGAFPDGFFKSVNGGLDWRRSDIGNPVLPAWIRALLIDPLTPDTVFACTHDGIYKSWDGGEEWFRSTERGCSSFAVDPTMPSTFYACSGSSILKSTDSGKLWKSISADIPKGLDLDTLAVDPGTPDTLYVGGSYWGCGGACSTGEILKSTNGGKEWQVMKFGFADSNYISIVVDPVTPTTVYAAMRGGVYKSTNAGNDWILINTGLTDTDVRPLLIDPSNPDVLFAGTEGGGVCRSTNGGRTWTPFNDGMPPKIHVYSLAADFTVCSLCRHG
jgi:photosystem II stability/assembly factor-like uncharacterized protein